MAEPESMDHSLGLRETKTEVSGDVSATDPVERLGLYLKPAAECMEAVQKMPVRKFNNEQCDYLADKLRVVLQSANSFLLASPAKSHMLSSSQHMEISVENFKFLLSLANEIESFIKGCCREDWIQAAMSLTNVSEYVSSIGFNLELCRVAFGKECAASGPLTLDQVADFHKSEVEVVEKKASADMGTLVAEVNHGLTGKSLSSEENKLAVHLLRRLQRVKTDPPDSFKSSWLSLLGDLYEWVKPLEQIGKGSFGIVYKAMWLGTQVAKKTFRGKSNPDFEKEAQILAGLCHPNITSMFCCELGRRNCSIIMELMDEDLFQLMQRRCESSSANDDEPPPFPILEAVDLMLQVGEGVNYLHHKVVPSIVHRDLKGTNILVKCVLGKESEIGYVQAKVADFGLSKTKDRCTRFSQQTPNTGTSRWMAPEIIKSGGQSEGSTSRSKESPSYPHKSDIYSFGMVCYEILTGHEPYPDEYPNSVKEKVIKGEHPRLPEQCPLELKHLLIECWSQEPKNRPSFDLICLRLKYLKYLLMTGFSSNQNPRLTTKEPLQTSTEDPPLLASTNVESELKMIQARYTIQDHSPWINVHGSPIEDIRPLEQQMQQLMLGGTEQGLIPSLQTPLPAIEEVDRHEIGKVSNEEQDNFQRLIQGILDKITPQNFDKVYVQIQEAQLDSATTLTNVVSQIYDRALMEPALCAQLCVKLAADLPEFVEDGKKVTFRHVLLNKLQGVFGRGEAEKDEEHVEKKMTKKKRQKARKTMIGNIGFAGELFKNGILTEKIIHECIKKLLGNVHYPNEVDVEALCNLMSTIGPIIDRHKAKKHIDAYFRQIESLSNNIKLSERLSSMLRDCIKLRRNGWQERREVPEMRQLSVGPTLGFKRDRSHYGNRDDLLVRRDLDQLKGEPDNHRVVGGVHYRMRHP